MGFPANKRLRPTLTGNSASESGSAQPSTAAQHGIISDYMGNTYVKGLARGYVTACLLPFLRICKLVLRFTFESIRAVLQPDVKVGIFYP